MSIEGCHLLDYGNSYVPTLATLGCADAHIQGLSRGSVRWIKGQGQRDPVPITVVRNVLIVDDSLDRHDAFQEHFRSWRTTWHVHIHREELIYPLDNRVGIEDTTG